ncbi:MAG: hypothetical protein DMG58_24485 [Acidobacteria bacterium]|nr:MAG: hypothetical protein DMG58_24485 [Acidobacteriota bacterium]
MRASCGFAGSRPGHTARSSHGLEGHRATPRQPLRWILVALQVALCTLLLSAAGLLFSTFNQLQALDPGFDRDHVVTFSVEPGMLSYTPQQSRNLRFRLQATVRELPGVASVGVASRGLMRGTGLKTTYAPAGEKAAPGDFMNTSLNWVSPEYFDTMGIRLLAGRNFRPDEVPAKPRQAIVNQAFARRFFPLGEAIGRTFGQGFSSQAANGNRHRQRR